MTRLSLALFSFIVIFGLSANTAQAQGGPRFNVTELETYAKRGDADAQFELGLRMITGEEMKKDPAAGLQWMEKAANQKHLRAQFVMGSLYEDGAGVKKDESKAVEWYRKSADNGFAPAQFAVAMAYDLGKGIKQDPVKATEWLEKAADQNHPQSQTALAAKLERGVGVTKNISKAALYYLRAAQQDHVQAMSRLANLYYTGSGVPLDYRRAGAWYQRAAKSDDPWSANNLAWFLATCPDEALQNGEQAVLFASRALRIMDESGEDQRYEMIDTKAACLARNGEYFEAILWQKKSLSLLAEDKDIPEEERKALETEFNGRLKRYQKETPYSEPAPKTETEAAPLPQDTILQDEGIPGDNAKPKKKKSGNKGTVV
jgi:TPR repeat protein